MELSVKRECLMPIFEALDTLLMQKSVVLAIDGRCASGKTTLGRLLEEKYDCTVFHMDDFFLRPEQRTSARYAEVGGNVDRERFLDEVLTPLSMGEDVFYRKLDCSTMTLCEAKRINPKRLVVIEGVYSMHTSLSDYYDLSVFLDVSKELQKERILKRSTQKTAQRFFDEWIPLEEIYFSKMRVRERCTLTISTDNL